MGHIGFLKLGLSRAVTATIAAVAVCLFGSVALAASAQQSRNLAVIQGIVIGSAAAREARDRANEQVYAAYLEIDSLRKSAGEAEQRARVAEQRALAEGRLANLADSRRRSAEAKAIAARADADRQSEEFVRRSEAWIEERRHYDMQFAAAEKVLRDHLTKLVEIDDPRIATALARYGRGEIAALDDLAEYTVAVVEARKAARAVYDRLSQKAIGDDLRALAAVWTSASDNGEKTAKEALGKWQDAAHEDPEEFGQWRKIFYLSSSDGNDDLSFQAADKVWKLAETDAQRAEASRICGIAHFLDGMHCNQIWNRNQYFAEAVRLGRLLVAASPQDGEAKENLAVALKLMAEEYWNEPKVREQLLRDALGIIDGLRAQNKEIAWSPWEFLRAQFLYDLGIRFEDAAERNAARSQFERNVGLARQILKMHPKSFTAKKQLAEQLGYLAWLEQGERNRDKVQALHDEAIGILEQALSNNSADLTRLPAAWHAYRRAANAVASFGDFERQAQYLRKAYALGHSKTAIREGYLTSMVIPELRRAEAMLGNLGAARKLQLEQLADAEKRFYELRDKGDGAKYCQDADVIFARLGLANLNWIERDYAAAEVDFATVQTDTKRTDCIFEMPSDEAALINVTVASSVTLMHLEQGKLAEAPSEIARILTQVRDRPLPGSNPAMSELLVMVLRMALADMTGSDISWADVQPLGTVDAIPAYVSVDLANIARYVAERKSQAPGPQAASLRDGYIAAHRRGLDAAQSALEKGSPSEAGFRLALRHVAMLAHLGEPALDWRVAANMFRDIHARGWIRLESDLAEMEFVLARAALEERASQRARKGIR